MRVACWILGLLLLSPPSWGRGGRAGVLEPDGPAPGEPERARARELFRQRVEPTLRAKCLGCHGDGEELEGALDLRSREAMLRGGKSGPAFVPGDPLASLIYQSVRRLDEGRMPPKDRDRLSPAEIDDLRAWIAMGAPWVRDEDRN
jgi:mono/diheme cytochrome c family protein